MKKNYYLLLITLLHFITSSAQITLTQSIDPININTSGTTCRDNVNNTYNENSFYRVYNLSDFGVTHDFKITSLQYGQGSANNGKLITLRIYTANSEDLTTATLSSVLGQTTHTSSSGNNLTLISEPLSLTIAAGSIIVFELLAGDSGSNTNENFIPGFNSEGENDDTYWRAPECTITSPATFSSFGLGVNQHVMNIIGEEVLGVEDFNLVKISINPNPTSDFINIELNESNSIKSTKIFSVTGQLVYKNTQVKRLDVSNLKPGVYILEVYTESGKATRKIIKR